MDDMSFERKVRARLAEIRMTQAALAERLETAPSRISTWLERNQPPTARYLLPLARQLGLTVDYLIDDAMDVPEKRLSPIERLILEEAAKIGVERTYRGLIIINIRAGRTEPGDRAWHVDEAEWGKPESDDHSRTAANSS